MGNLKEYSPYLVALNHMLLDLGIDKEKRIKIINMYYFYCESVSVFDKEYLEELYRTIELGLKKSDDSLRMIDEYREIKKVLIEKKYIE